MIFLILEQVEPPPLDMAIKPWEFEMNAIFHPLAPISLALSSKKMNTKDSALVAEETYFYIYVGNGARRTFEGCQNSQVYPWTWKLRIKQIDARP